MRGLEVGSVFTRLGYQVDDDGADKYERRTRSLRSDAQRPVVTEAKLDVDKRGFDSYNRHVDDVDRGQRNLVRGSGRLRGALGTLFIGGAGFAGAGLAAGVAAKGLFAFSGAASDVGESLSKNEQLFGRHAKSVDRWSKTTTEGIGVSRSAALEAAGTFGNLFIALELGPGKSAKMSKALVGLAGDLASFNNASPEEAMEAIRSGLVGETEPLRKFGVNLNDAALRAEALSMGLVKSTKEALTPQAKALAVNALLFKQTEKAQGDFKRTSDGNANQQRILKANLADTAAELGETFLPTTNRVFSGLNRLFKSTRDGDSDLGRLAKTVRGGLGSALNWVKGVFGTVNDVIHENRKRLDSIGTTVRGMAGNVGRLLSGIGRAFGDVFGGGSGIGKDIRAIIRQLLAFYDIVLKVYKAIADKAIPGIIQAFRGLAQMIRGVIRIIAGILTGDFGKAWDGVKDIFSGAVKVVVGLLKTATAPFRAAAAAIGKAVAEPLSKAWDGIKRTAVGFINGIIGILNKIPGVDIGKIGKDPTSANTKAYGNASPQPQGHYREGGKVTMPIAVMGEEAPQHPEWVIPTNPAYRSRAVGLWMAAAKELGIPGFALGGVLDTAKDFVTGGGLIGMGVRSAKDLIEKLPANPGGMLSGAYGYAKDKAADYIRSKSRSIADALGFGGGGGGGGRGDVGGLVPQVLRALAFARAHGWKGSVNSGYRSDAEQVRIWNSGIRPAAKPRSLGGPGSNHSGGEAVDVSDVPGFARAMAMMGAGRLYNRVPNDALHFSVTGFKKGGKTGKTPKPTLSKADDRGIRRSVNRGERGIAGFETKIQGLEREYGQMDRRFGLSEEDWLIENDDGSVSIAENVKGARLREIDALITKRADIRQAIKDYRAAVSKLLTALRKAVKQLQDALGKAKGKSRQKERGGYRQAIEDHTARIGELKGIFGDLGFDMEDADIDLDELRGERTAVAGAAGSAAPASTGDSSGSAGGDTSSADPDVAAQLAQSETARVALAADLQAARSNLAAFGSSGDIGTGGYANAFAAGAAAHGVGVGPGGSPAGAVGAFVGQGDRGLVVEIHSMVPPRGAELVRVGRIVTEALDNQAIGARPANRQKVL